MMLTKGKVASSLLTSGVAGVENKVNKMID